MVSYFYLMFAKICTRGRPARCGINATFGTLAHLPIASFGNGHNQARVIIPCLPLRSDPAEPASFRDINQRSEARSSETS